MILLIRGYMTQTLSKDKINLIIQRLEEKFNRKYTFAGFINMSEFFVKFKSNQDNLLLSTSEILKLTESAPDNNK